MLSLEVVLLCYKLFYTFKVQVQLVQAGVRKREAIQAVAS